MNNADHSLQVFYGLLTNSQLAAYSYKIAFARVHSLILAYNPRNELWLSGAKLAGFVRTARLDYVRSGVTCRHHYLTFCVQGDGIASGLQEEVRKRKQRRERRRLQRLKRLEYLQERLKKSKEGDGQAVSSKDLRNFEQFVKTGRTKDTSGTVLIEGFGDDAEREDESSDEDIDDFGSMEEGFDWQEEDDDEDLPMGEQLQFQIERTLEMTNKRLAVDARKQKSEQALVVHQESIAENVLKDHNIELGKPLKASKRSTPWNRAAWEQGRVDSHDIDLEQRAIEEKSSKAKASAYRIPRPKERRHTAEQEEDDDDY